MTNNKPKKISHIADIHFFVNKRHAEFKELTRKYCQQLTEEEIDIVYVGGDVIDSKARLSPEQVEAVTHFFYSISNICPMIVIPGNHDLNLQKKGSLDSLTPIINNINSKHPIFYLTDSGIYNLYNIDWVVWSCIDNLNPFTLGKKETDYSIGCYHGMVKGSTTDSGWSLEGGISLDAFKDVSLVFLGDIHARQYFRNDEIAYPGSWTQINMGEDVEKGTLIWEWNNEEKKYISKFKRLENDHGFITYEIKDLETWNEKVTAPTEKFIIRLLYTGTEDNFSAIKFIELKKKLKLVLPNEIILQKRFKKKSSSKTIKQKDKEVTDFFTEFYKDDTTEEQIAQLKAIDDHYNKIIDSTDYQIGEYFIEEIEINNFLCFGENNIINFAATPGLIGILGENRIGKSSILESLAFCLFNRSTKGSTSLSKLINDQQPEGTKAFVQVKLTINGSHWRIKRTIVPSSTGGKIKLEVYEIVDGIEEPRHEESRPQTDAKVLRKLLGDEEIFLTTILCTADNLADFAKNRNADRLDLIIKFLGISIYDQKHKLCDEELKKVGYLYEQLKEELDKLTPLNELDLERLEVLSELSGKKNTSANYELEINNLLSSNKELEDQIKDLNIIGVTKTIAELKKELDLIEKDSDLKTIELKQHTKEKDRCFKAWDRKEPIKEWEDNPNKFDNLKQKISEYKLEIKHLRAQLDSEVCPTCKQTWHKIDRVKIKKEIEDFESKIKDAEETIESHRKGEEVSNKLQAAYLMAVTQIELCKSKMELFTNKQETILQQMKIVEDNALKIKKKEKYEESLSVNNTNIKSTQKLKQTIDSEILFCKKELDTIDNNIRLYKKKVEDIKEQEAFTKGLQLYKKGMHRTGIPSLILGTYIPAINSEINSQINDLFELNVKFELNANNLEISFYYDEFYNEGKGKRDITQASGMEGVVINLAIRAALSKISLLPKPSLWMLDEVFNPLDAINIEQIKPYLIRLKDQYHNILVISHKDEIKDLPEHFILLEKNDGVTSIV